MFLGQHININLCAVQEMLGSYSIKCLNTLLSKNLVICQAEIGSNVKGTLTFEKSSLQVLKFLGPSLQRCTVSR